MIDDSACLGGAISKIERAGDVQLAAIGIGYSVELYYKGKRHHQICGRVGSRAGSAHQSTNTAFALMRLLVRETAVATDLLLKCLIEQTIVRGRRLPTQCALRSCHACAVSSAETAGFEVRSLR